MQSLKRIVTLIIMSVLMVSTMNFSIGRHYCMGKIVAQELYTTPQMCDSEPVAHCADESATQVIDFGCCESRQIVFHGIELLTFQKYNTVLLSPFISQAVYDFIPEPVKTEVAPAYSQIFRVVNSGRTLLLLHQVFRI